MNKKLPLFLIVFLSFVLVSFSQNINIFLNAGTAGKISLSSYSYLMNWSVYGVEVDEKGSVTPSSSSPTFALAGLEAEISDGFGIYVSYGVSKQSINVLSNYSLSIPRANVYNEGFSMESSGDVSLNLLNLGIFKGFRISKAMSISIFGGVSMVKVKNSLEAVLGYAAYMEDENYIYFDYFPFNLYNDETISKTGFQAGASLTYRISYNLGVFASFNYFSVKNVDCEWRVRPAKYNGEFGNLVFNVKDENFLKEVGYSPEFTIKPSFYSFSLGIKIFF